MADKSIYEAAPVQIVIRTEAEPFNRDDVKTNFHIYHIIEDNQ